MIKEKLGSYTITDKVGNFAHCSKAVTPSSKAVFIKRCSEQDAQNEVQAYLVSRWLGWQIVRKSRIAKTSANTYVITAWIDGQTAQQLGDKKDTTSPSARKIRLLDHLIGNYDRHDQNIMQYRKRWYGIDHTMIMGGSAGGGWWGYEAKPHELRPDERQALQRLAIRQPPPGIRQELVTYVLTRAKRILETGLLT